MTIPTTFVIAFFLGFISAGIVFFLALTFYYWKLALDAQKEIYGNDEKDNRTETN